MSHKPGHDFVVQAGDKQADIDEFGFEENSTDDELEKLAAEREARRLGTIGLFTVGIGNTILAGLYLAGETVGQPRQAMQLLWSGSWDRAQDYMEELFRELDTQAEAFQRIVVRGRPAPKQIAGLEPATGQELGSQFGAPSVRPSVGPRGRAGSEDDRGQRAGDGAGISGRRFQSAGSTRIPGSFKPDVGDELGGQFQAGPSRPEDVGNLKQQLGRNWYFETLAGIEDMNGKVWDWYRQHVSFDIGDLNAQPPRTGSGSRGPTAQEIRDQFDLDKLTRRATDIWRTTLLTDEVDTRRMARAYIDAIVKSNGTKEIDFTEFITKKAEATDRFASIYRSKPASMSTSEYLLPYFQAAASVAGPGEAAEIAIQGAQFGADPNAFSARLNRTDAATSSSAFVNSLHSRLSDLNTLFGGG